MRDAHGCGEERYATHTTTGAQSEQAPQRLRGRGVESGLAHFVTTNEEKGIYGPGHNSFTKDEEGNDIIVYHARTEAEIVGNPLYNPNRHAMLMKVKWSEDGRPVFDYE